MSKLFTDFEMTKDEYNSFEEWLNQHDKEIIQDYIDKVVEELEKTMDSEYQSYYCLKHECDFDDSCCNCMIKNAIEIVKRGGENDD